MARLDDIQRQALARWWTDAEWAASHGYQSTDLTAAIANYASGAGQPLAFRESQAIAVLYGYGFRMFAAGEQMRAATPESVIGPEMIAVPPWARDEQVMLTTPIWHVTYQMSFVDQAGMLQTDFRTSVFEMTFPETIGELQAAVNEDAQNAADKYNVMLTDVQLHQILAV